jgi:hypothetical protein
MGLQDPAEGNLPALHLSDQAGTAQSALGQSPEDEKSKRQILHPWNSTFALIIGRW